MPEQKVTNRVGFLSSLSESDLQALLTGAKRLPFRKDEDILIQGRRRLAVDPC